MTTSGRVLSEKMDVFRLSFYTAPVSCIALLPFVYLREVRRVATTSVTGRAGPRQFNQSHIRHGCC